MSVLLQILKWYAVGGASFFVLLLLVAVVACVVEAFNRLR